MKKLEDKVAIVTGGASGIGEAIVRLFAQEGAQVICVDLNAENGEALVAELEETTPITFKQADVAEEKRVAEVFEEVIEEFGRVDILINNAGVNTYIPSEERPFEDFQWTTNINLNAVFLWSQHAVRDMLAKDGGVIVNTASKNGVHATGGNAAYDASKAGVIHLTESMAQEYADRGIRINAVSPGFVDTPMVPEGTIDAVKSTIPMKRAGTVEEIAKPVLFLCTEDASYITGHNLLIDGGYVTQ